MRYVACFNTEIACFTRRKCHYPELARRRGLERAGVKWNKTGLVRRCFKERRGQINEFFSVLINLFANKFCALPIFTNYVH